MTLEPSDISRADRPPASHQRDAGAGRLVLAATPIGNTADASPRLRDLLAEADVVAAEDTRRVRALAARLGVEMTGRVVSHHEHNEASRVEGLLEDVRGGATVLVVSDAGTPAVSDPGYRLVVAAIAAGLPLTAVPGPSAVTTALAVSGLPTDRFTFEGFMPRRPADRRRLLAELVSERRTMVFFESPRRLPATLVAMSEAFGPERPATVCRELTKTYEEVVRGPLEELTAWAAAGPVLGEITVVVGGATRPTEVSWPELVAQVERRVAGGERLKDAAGAVAGDARVGRRDLYERVLAERAEQPTASSGS